MLRSRPALHADQADRLLADARYVRCDRCTQLLGHRDEGSSR